MQYSNEFYTNVALFVLALVVLGLSIWAFVTPCKKDGFGDQVECGCSKIEHPSSPDDCGQRNGATGCGNKQPGWQETCIHDFSTGKDNCCGNSPSGDKLMCLRDPIFHCSVCK